MGFFFFNGDGFFIWVIPFLVIGLVIRLLRHRSRWQEPDESNHWIEPRNEETLSERTDGNPVESKIFKLAYRFKGRITLSDIVMETEMGLKQAEQVMKEIVDNVHVTMEIKDSGVVYYEFPEIIARFDEESSGD